MTRSMLTRLWPLPLLVAACSRPGGGPAPVASASVSPSVVSPAPASSPSRIELPTSGLPAVASAASGAAGNANAVNVRALREHQAGNYDVAAKGFEEAVRADPSHVLARYNLACALARSGDRSRSLATLYDLAHATSCDACKKQLAFARQDPDLDAVRSDVWFSAMTSVAANGPLPPKVVVSAATTAISASKADAIAPFVRAETVVKTIVTDSLAQDGERAARVDTKPGDVAGARLATLLRGATPGDRLGFEAMAGPVCDATCCRHKPPGLLHHTLYLTRVCVEHDDQGRAWLSEVALIDGD